MECRQKQNAGAGFRESVGHERFICTEVSPFEELVPVISLSLFDYFPLRGLFFLHFSNEPYRNCVVYIGVYMMTIEDANRPFVEPGFPQV